MFFPHTQRKSCPIQVVVLHYATITHLSQLQKGYNISKITAKVSSSNLKNNRIYKMRYTSQQRISKESYKHGQSTEIPFLASCCSKEGLMTFGKKSANEKNMPHSSQQRIQFTLFNTKTFGNSGFFSSFKQSYENELAQRSCYPLFFSFF